MCPQHSPAMAPGAQVLHDTDTGPSGSLDSATAGCGAGERTASACAPCVAALATPQDRLEAVRAALAREAEPLVALTHLLHLCRDQHAELWERIGDPDCRHRVTAALEPLAGMLAARAGTTTVDPALGRALADALVAVEGVPAVAVARALAELLDEHFADSFTASFRRRSPYRPGVGDPIPLDAPDLRGVTRMPPTAPPWRLANRLDETRHVRLAGDWAVQFRVVFDYSLYDVLSGLVTAETVVATCHPNRAMEELELPKDAEGRTFPVRPANPARQYRQIDRLIGRAAAARAAIVVLPELSVTESLARRLRAWVQRPDGPRLLVTGSYHHQDPPGGEPTGRRRRNTALAWVRGHDQPLLHDKHSPADRPVVEDIRPQGWPEQRVYVLADGWHLVIAICRDLLNPEAVHTLAEAGANLVLVPAMSESLTAFGGPAAHLVGARQALVAVANNPGQWPDALGAARGPARALFGHPGFARQTRLVHTSDPGPGVALLTVGSGQIGWLDDPAGPTARETAQHGTQATAPAPRRPDEPGWLAPLTAHLLAFPASGATAPEQVPLRPSAVLVLLTDGGTGPRVLLTERTGDLGDYPGRLVYPGGAADPRDAGPAATALREAHEETGLDPDSVQVIGALPAFALPESGFLVTPVLAWSAAPAFSAGINPAEVRALGHVRLTEVACGGNANDHSDGSASVGVMTAAVADLLTGMLARAGHGDRASPSPCRSSSC
ncbi:NUDIX domain-containing protein [Streptomyces maremycinicus]|uniref:NUDIX domain-containing protein n=1 Tax=Streptomyces maremycinicus TaxID=1679753 RepID=UPI001F2DD31D|nr:NUDIX domain-containing protein [Streptomyces sp. NBRC 110468]